MCVEYFGHQTLLPVEFLKQLRPKGGVEVGLPNIHICVVRGPWGLPAGNSLKQMKTSFLEEER